MLFRSMKNEYYHHYKIVNIKHTEKQIKGLEFVFVELPKFKPQNRAVKKLHDLWLRFLTEINESTKEIPKEMLKNKHIAEAIGYMERSAYTKEELARYGQWKIDSMTATAMLENAREEGKAEGEAIGLEKGRAERDEIKIQMLINAYREGVPIEKISAFSGLSTEEIKKIIENQKK